MEGQALREQALGLVPPKHLKRPLDVARWYTTELLKFEAQVKHRFPELLIGEQEGVLCLMKHLDSETKRYLLLHHSTKSMGELMTGLQFYDEQLRVMDFQREGASGYANAFKGGKGGKGDRDKSNKGSKGNKGNKGEKGEKGLKGGKAKGKDKKGDQGGKGDRARSKSREAKKTDVCRNCGKTGHWARDCWAPPKDKAAAATSQAVTTQPEAPSSSSSTSAKAAAQPTTKGSGKAQSSIKTFLEGYHFGMMLTNQVVSFPSDDRVYWLIDSGSSFHIITRETLESDHVKVLAWLEGRPKSYAETATGDSVEIGGSTHVLVEVCFETTTSASLKSSSEHEGDAVYMCRARFEAVISDQIKHNLLNINLLCQNGGWEPAMCDQQGVITVRKHGVTLRPTMFASVSWLASVRNDHPLALKPQDLIAKTEQFRRSRSRKSSSSRDLHRSTSNRGHRSSARVCVEPKNPELLDVSCLDEVVDCEFQTSHEHVDLDQGEAKDRLRTVGDVSGSARDQLQFFSHVDTPIVRELGRDERLIFSEDNSVISHKQQDNSTTPAVERLVFENDSSVISHKQQDNSTTPAVERLVHEHGRETVVCRACLEDFPDEVEIGSLDCSKRRSFPRVGQIGDRRYGSECHDATKHSRVGRHAPGARRRRLILLEANAAQHGIELPQNLREELQATYAEAESTGGDEMDLDPEGDSARLDPSTSSPSIEYIMEETEAAEAPSSHTGVREFQTDPSMSEAPAEEPAIVLMKPTPKIKPKEKGKATRPVRNLLPDHVDQSTMGVDPREPSGPTPGSSAPTRRGKRRWASTGWMTWIARRFGGAWTAQAPGDSDPPDTPVTLYCLLCQKYVTEAHLMSEPHEANMQGFTHVISKEGLRVTQNPVNWATWEEALAEPEQLELGVTEGKARSVVALGPSEFPQPIPKETTAAAPPSPGPGPSTVVVEIDESDEDWGEWRPTTEVPAPSTPPHPKDPPISMMQPPGEPVSPTAVYTEHRRGPEPRQATPQKDCKPSDL